MITYQNTTKREWAEIAFNLAMQLSADDEFQATKRLEEEKRIIIDDRKNW
jgi:hypothetical protein